MPIDIGNKVVLKPEFLGKKLVTISKSGFGKSYTCRVCIEEGVELGGTFLIIDPQDAYLNLEGFEYINGADIKSAKGLGILLSQTNKNTVILTKGLSEENQNKLVGALLSSYKKNVQKGIQTIVIDELHKFAPNVGNTEAKSVIRSLYQENRSDGIGIWGVSQRPARIDTTILSQADNLFLGRVTSLRDKQALGNYLDSEEDVNKLPDLKKGEFFLAMDDLDKPIIVQIRKSKTKHSGEAPKNLLKENINVFNNHINSVVKKRKKVEDDGEKMAGKDIIEKIVPSRKSFVSKAMTGVTIFAGFGLNGVVSSAVAKVIPQSPLPFVSTRTIASLVSTLALNTVSNFSPIKNAKVREAMDFAVAGSAAATIGSGLVDGWVALGLPIPQFASSLLKLGTGVDVASESNGNGGVDSSPGTQAVDVTTAFA